MRMIDMLRALVYPILKRPHDHEWSVQGFGMLRTYLDGDDVKRYRLNIWDAQLEVPSVSLIHDHPWHFTSIVLSGALINSTYFEHHLGEPHEWMTIKTGEGGGPISNKPNPIVNLRVLSSKLDKGAMYSQKARDIHRTSYSDGAVTINDRDRVNGELARVFWEKGKSWVDAAPRPATRDEIDRTINKALVSW